MKELFLKFENDLVPISPEMIKKYKLIEGTMSPFTRIRVVNKDGKFTIEHHKKKNDPSLTKENVQMFTTAESIDIASGVDSTI